MHKPLTSHLEKSVISNVIQTARACLNEPSRPYTPAEGQRALFSQNDYANRPPSTHGPKPVLRKVRNRSQDGAAIRSKEKWIGKEAITIPSRDLETIDSLLSPTLASSAPVRPVKLPQPAEATKSDPEQTFKSLLRSLLGHEEARELYGESDWAELANKATEVGQMGKKEEVATAVIELVEEVSDPTAQILLLTAVFGLISGLELVKRKESGELKTIAPLQAAARLVYYPSKDKSNDMIYHRTGLLTKLIETVLAVLSHSSVSLQGGSEALPTQMLIYLLGTLKNLSEQDFAQERIISLGLLPFLLRLMPEAASDNSTPARAQVLIQVTGILRSLVSNRGIHSELMQLNVAARAYRILELFLEHPELVYNTVRVISKLSEEDEFGDFLLDRNNLYTGVTLVLKAMLAYGEKPPVVSRAAFALANLCMQFDEPRAVIGPEGFDSIVENVVAPFIPAAIGSKLHFDGLLKSVRLLANVLLDPETGVEMTKGQLAASTLLEILSQFSAHEEMTLVTVSCLANLLYYDSPQQPLLTDSALRSSLVRKLQPALLQTVNFEVTREALRALSNLTRFEAAAREVGLAHILEPLLLLLDHSSAEVVFYCLGCITNLSHLAKDLVYSEQWFARFVGLLGEAGVAALDVSVQAAMVLANLCTPTKGFVPWEGVAGEETVKHLSSLLTSLISEAEALESASQLLSVLRTLKEAMPGDLLPCPVKGCGRKFPSQEKLKEHWERRHND